MALATAVLLVLPACSEEAPLRDPVSGEVVWAHQGSGASGDAHVRCIGLLDDDSLLVGGGYEGSLTLRGADGASLQVTAPDGGESGFVARYRLDGSLVWATDVPGDLWDCAVRDAASFVVVGSFEATRTFDAGGPAETTLTSAGDEDAFVARYDASGQLLEVKSMTGPDRVHASSVAVRSDGSFVVAGTSHGPTTFGVGEPGELTVPAVGESDAFVASFDSSGAFQWVERVIGSESSNRATDVAVDAEGAAFVTGQFTLTATWGAGSPNESQLTAAEGGDMIGVAFGDLYVAKWDSAGAFLWVRQGAASDTQSGMSLSVDADGAVLVGGGSWCCAVFAQGEPDETTVSGRLFVARYSGAGDFLWARTAKETLGYEEEVLGVSTYPDGSSLLSGYVYETGLFGEGEPQESTIGILDANSWQGFVARYAPDGSLMWVRHFSDPTGYSMVTAVLALPDGGGVAAGLFDDRGIAGPGEPREAAFTALGERDFVLMRLAPDVLPTP